MPEPAFADRAALEARAATVATRGRALFHLELATALATDWARHAGLLSATDFIVVDVGPDGHDAIVVRMIDGAPTARARVTFAADGRALGEAVDRADTQANDAGRFRGALAWHQRRTALAVAHVRAATHGQLPAAIVAIPPQGGPRADPEPLVEVYALRTPPDAATIILGPHTRHEVDPARGVLTIHAFGPDRALSLSDAPDPLALVDSNSPVPTEIHTYLAMRQGRTLVVDTPKSGLTWTVDANGAAAHRS